MFFDIGEEKCPFCNKKLDDELQAFKDFFSDNNPFSDIFKFT